MLPYIFNALPIPVDNLRHQERATPSETYLDFQLPGFTTTMVAHDCRELLPRVFTLISQLADGIFSVALSVTRLNSDTLPLASGMHYVARTFLPKMNLER